MVETRVVSLVSKPHLQGLRDTEPLGYGARKKTFHDLSLTFRSTLLPPGLWYLRSPCEAFMKRQMLPVSISGSSSLPPRTQPWSSSGGSWLTSFCLDHSYGFVIKLATPALPFATLSSFCFFFKSQSSLSLFLLLICNKNNQRLLSVNCYQCFLFFI